MLNSRDKNDKTPLHYAATKGNLQVRKFERGNNVGFCENNLHIQTFSQKRTPNKLKVPRSLVAMVR